MPLRRSGPRNPVHLEMTFTLTRRFLALAGSVCVLHTAVTVLEEAFFNVPGFRHGIFLSFCTFSGIALIYGTYLALLELRGGRSVAAAVTGELRRLSECGAAQSLGIVIITYVTSTSLSKVRPHLKKA